MQFEQQQPGPAPRLLLFFFRNGRIYSHIDSKESLDDDF